MFDVYNSDDKYRDDRFIVSRFNVRASRLTKLPLYDEIEEPYRNEE